MSVFEPKRSKFRKIAMGRNRGPAKNATTIAFGEFALVALERGSMRNIQIEAVRKVFTNYFKRTLKIWIRIFPNKTHTRRPGLTRLGGGKGDVKHWYFNVKPGRILFEFAAANETSIRTAARIAGSKLPFRCHLISKSQEKHHENTH